MMVMAARFPCLPCTRSHFPTLHQVTLPSRSHFPTLHQVTLGALPWGLAWSLAGDRLFVTCKGPAALPTGQLGASPTAFANPPGEVRLAATHDPHASHGGQALP